MQIRAIFEARAFSCWIPETQEWTTPSSYKEIILARRRALIDRDASPVPARRVRFESGYQGVERRQV